MKDSWGWVALGAVLVGVAYFLFDYQTLPPSGAGAVAETSPGITEGRLPDGSPDHQAATQPAINPKALPAVTRPATPQVPMIEPKVYPSLPNSRILL